ncbi:hypothetical protein Y032_0360g3445 [Ancylostoma ceylanicum]|uniref:Uncharacterized protein n=1 Tax=Ancylostoma ceylanicum TaxID=53326 RepID=A0A016RVR1_9BILA|nr:hypothetical protein Y032_0360g3445 [Ancylostoma ceylanicum]
MSKFLVLQVSCVNDSLQLRKKTNYFIVRSNHYRRNWMKKQLLPMILRRRARYVYHWSCFCMFLSTHFFFYVGQTFVIGGGCDAESLLQRIDDLEARLREEQEERSKASSALAAYMSRYHKLEKKLQEGQVLVGSSSFNNKEEARERAVQIYDRLCNLALENRELRKECARLCKQNSILSANSTSHSIRHTESPSFIDAVADKSSLLTDEHLEEKVC